MQLTSSISIAFCFPLSWKLLIYALPTLFVASLSKPANVFLPVLVALVLSAPVPAYILDNRSPLSAHNVLWAVQKVGLEARIESIE